MNEPPPDDDARISELLLAWEEARAAGRPRSPADLCRSAPELIERLKREIDRLEAIDRFLRGGGSGPPGEAV